MTVRVRAERGGKARHLHNPSWRRQSTMGIANSRGVLQGTRGRAGAQRVQRVVGTPVRAHGAAARVAHLSAST